MGTKEEYEKLMEMQAAKKKEAESKYNIMKEESKVEEIMDDNVQSVINKKEEKESSHIIENTDILPKPTISKKDEKTIITNPANKPEIKPSNIKPHLEQEKLKI